MISSAKNLSTNSQEDWLGLIAGNSQLHWAWFRGETLLETWDTPHLRSPLISLTDIPTNNQPTNNHPLNNQPTNACPGANISLYFASVVPAQTTHIQAFIHAREITLADIPIQNLYSTLGIDRALALLGAGDRHGWPALVIDGGTALTLTGADESGHLVGGAILPGVQLQFDSLGQGTAALPQLQTQAKTKPPERWACSTEGAIASGVLHSLTSSLKDYIQDWKKRYPSSSITLTGGAGERLATLLPPEPQRGWSAPIPVVAALAAWGLRAATARYRAPEH